MYVLLLYGQATEKCRGVCFFAATVYILSLPVYDYSGDAKVVLCKLTQVVSVVFIAIPTCGTSRASLCLALAALLYVMVYRLYVA